MAGTVMVVVGGQFGSEGKGRIVASLSERCSIPFGVVRVGGPNAGHTTIDAEGNVWKLRHIPAAAVINTRARLLIGRGSEIDGDILAEEIEELEEKGYNITNRLVVDRSASLICGEDLLVENTGGLVDRIGSTGKGVGSARSRRIMREADVFGGLGDVALEIDDILDYGGAVVVEGTQGWGLGLHTDFYPRCTSSDCDAGAMASMAGVIPWAHNVAYFEVWVVLRTLPIRVVGNSGPLKNETTWSELGIAAEHTTVTKKVRRVGLWDADLARAAIRGNGGPGDNVKVALTGLDLLFEDLVAKRGTWKGVDEIWEHDEAWAWIVEREKELGCEFSAVGIGPGQGDLLWR